MPKKIYLLFLIFSIFFIVLPLAAFGATTGIVPCDNCGLCDFFKLITNIFDFIRKLAPLVGAFFFAWAGFEFLTSGGSEERITSAKKRLLTAFIGLFVIYASWLIVNTLITVVAENTDGFKKDTWYQFECTTQTSSFNSINSFDNF